MKRLGGGVLVLVALAGCVNSANVKAYRLFQDPSDAFNGTAILIGDVEQFDGVSVSKHGHRFEVLPGCHTVTNVTTWGGMDPNAAVMAHLPQMPFSMEMKAGMTYVLRIAIVGPAQEGGRLRITLREQDADGNVLRTAEAGSHC
jgi:hypothetical protein